MKSTGEKPLFAYLKDEECVAINGGFNLGVQVAPNTFLTLSLPDSIPKPIFTKIADEYSGIPTSSPSPRPPRDSKPEDSSSALLLLGGFD